MTKKKNKGLTMVEILIALAIFMILMVPIEKAIISSLKSTTSAKEVQYRNDFATDLMEHVKAVSADEIENTAYYTEKGATDVTVGSALSGTGEYQVEGKIELGVEHTKYTFRVEASTDYYSSSTVSYFNPNDIAIGKVENLDYRNVAYIDGTVLNNDSSVEDYFKLEKLSAMKDIDPVGYKQQMEGDADILNSDVGMRLATIEVSGNSTKGYRVRCIFTYTDSNTQYLTNNVKDVTCFDQTYSGSLPNIYFTYNPCFYNNSYATDDYVAVDLSGLEDESEVNLYLVELSEKMSQNLVNSGAADDITDSKGNSVKDQTIYNDKFMNSIARDDVNIHIVGVSSGASKIKKQLHVYHNIGDNTYEEEDSETNLKLTYDKTNKKSDSDKLKYTADDGSVDSTLTGSFAAATGDSYFALDDTIVQSMSDDETKSRSLYQVKIWIQKGDSVDVNEDPILEGSKGGSKS